MGTRGLLGLIYNERSRSLLSLDDEKLKIMLDRIDQLQWVDNDAVVPETDLAHYEEIIHRDRKEEKGMWIYNCWTDEVERRGRRRETTWGNLFRGVAVRQCLPSIFDGPVRHLVDETGFEDVLSFCEYAYWMNFDNKTLVVVPGLEGDVDDPDGESWTGEGALGEDGVPREGAGGHVDESSDPNNSDEEQEAIPWSRLTKETITKGRLINPKRHVSSAGFAQVQGDRDKFTGAVFKGIGVQAVSSSTMDALVA